MAEFMMLSPEIRLMIYNYLVDNTNGKRPMRMVYRGRVCQSLSFCTNCALLPGGVSHKSHSYGCCSGDNMSAGSVHHAKVDDLLALMRVCRLVHLEAEPVLYQRVDLTVVGSSYPDGLCVKRALQSDAFSARALHCIRDIHIDPGDDAFRGLGRPQNYWAMMNSLTALLPSLEHLTLGLSMSDELGRPEWLVSDPKIAAMAKAVAASGSSFSITIVCSSRVNRHADRFTSRRQSFRHRLRILRQALNNAQEERL